MPMPIESEKENYKKKFIASLYTEAAQNTRVSLQSQPGLYRFVITRVDAVVPEESGQPEASNSIAGMVGMVGSAALARLSVVGSRAFGASYASASVPFYLADFCGPFEKGFSEGNQTATYATSSDHLIISESSADSIKDNPTECARRTISQFSNQNISVEALKIFERLQQLLKDSHIKNLPPIRSFVLEDGSLLIELISAHSRLGFSIEQDRRESSWYLVTDETQGNIRASGDIGNDDIERPVKWSLTLLG